MRYKLSACRLCATLPKVGRTEKNGKGPWVIFCEGLDHYIEVTGKTRSPAMKAWEAIHGDGKRLGRADHEYLQRLYGKATQAIKEA